MASVTKEEIPDVARFMTDFWNLLKKYYKPEDTDEYWDNLLDDSEILYNSTQDRLCRQMVLDLSGYLEGKLYGKSNNLV